MRSSTFISMAVLASGAISATINRRVVDQPDHSHDGIYPENGKVGDFPKRDLSHGPVTIARRQDDHSHDGIYTTNGKVSDLTKRTISDISGTTVSARDEAESRLMARGNNFGCDEHIAVSPSNYDNAKKALLDYCKTPGSKCNQTIWSKSGEAVIFFCRWKDSAAWNPDSLTWSLDQIKVKCGNNQGGNANDQDGDEKKRTWSYGVTDWVINDWCNMPAGYPN